MKKILQFNTKNMFYFISVSWLSIFHVVAEAAWRMHDKNPPKTHFKGKKHHNLLKVRNTHLFCRVYCVFETLSVKKENNSGGKFSKERLSKIKREWRYIYCIRAVQNIYNAKYMN